MDASGDRSGSRAPLDYVRLVKPLLRNILRSPRGVVYVVAGTTDTPRASLHGD